MKIKVADIANSHEMAKKWDRKWSLSEILTLIDNGFDAIKSRSSVRMRHNPLEPIDSASVIAIHIAKKVERKVLAIQQWYA